MINVPLSQLKTVVMLYLQKDFPALEDHPLLAQGDESGVTTAVDTLFIQAANNAVRRAEQEHDFHFMERSLEGTIPAGTAGLSMEGLTEYGEVDTYDVKTLQTCFVEDTSTGVLRVVRHEARKRLTDRLVEQEDLRQWDQVEEVMEGKVLTHGKKLFVYPTNTTAATSIVIDAYVWATLFTDTDDTSDFLNYAFEYMQWATVVELNMLLQTFVIRQEGSLPPPTKERDIALRRLIDWDNYQTESGRNIILD